VSGRRAGLRAAGTAVAAVVVGLIVAVVAAGCGSGGHGDGPATRTSRSGARISHLVTTSTTSSATVPPAQPVADHHRRHHRGGGYGRLPSWLPRSKPPTQRPLHASFSHPVLTIQGDSLVVSVGGARLVATAVGPSVPEIGHTPVPATSPVTFVVTFSHVTAPIALRRASFVLVDEQHQLHQPLVTALHGGPPPSELRPGPPVSIKLRSVLPTGDGGLEWRPTGERAIAGWDFNVEID
jgi:hypothetical protein